MNPASRFFTLFFVASVFFWAAIPSAAQKIKDQDCLACHSDATATTQVNGKTVSLFVDRARYKHSIHGSMFSCPRARTG